MEERKWKRQRRRTVARKLARDTYDVVRDRWPQHRRGQPSNSPFSLRFVRPQASPAVARASCRFVCPRRSTRAPLWSRQGASRLVGTVFGPRVPGGVGMLSLSSESDTVYLYHAARFYRFGCLVDRLKPPAFREPRTNVFPPPCQVALIARVERWVSDPRSSTSPTSLMPSRVGAWYMVTPQEEGVDVAWQKEMVDKAEPKVCMLRYCCKHS